MDDPPDDWEDDYDQFARYEYENDCDHAEADIDIMTGRLSCRCGLRRAATTQEIEAEMRWQAEYMQQQHEEALAWEREKNLIKCSRCNGSGSLHVDEPECNGGVCRATCEKCGGKGYLAREQHNTEMDARSAT